MALQTLGTTSTTVLPALRWNPMSPIADIAAIARNIKSQANPTQPIAPGAFANNGRLHFPGHFGFILLKPGDVIAYDNNGWPTLVSSQSIARGGSNWVLT